MSPACTEQEEQSAEDGPCSLRPPGQDMDEEATCSICLELLTEPVTIGCAHNFCRACITKYCEDAVRGSGNAVPCPSCRAQFQIGSFRLNTQLKNLVEKIKEQSLKPGKEQMATQCLEHEEKLKLFCEEDGEAICVICRESQAHRGHTVLPIQEAANDYQQHLTPPVLCQLQIPTRSQPPPTPRFLPLLQILSYVAASGPLCYISDLQQPHLQS
ncbi:E3 ubiquitin-protein ligase TRIM52-like [Alligator mississippiensis]|uniref:E3 ubiquitin-protein ligase TRIM52-like n=1 Tax=Alligator mississippiensis TaxID=8496 RepID=UPI002877628B|nr:E3 ubiquitin-protein ligase TRIM52-like [Alligator mississippiensis]